MKVSYQLCVLGLVIASSVVAQDAPKANLQLTMLTKVNPQGLALWDVTNNSQDEKGYLDPKKLTAEKWAKLMKIGKALEEAGMTLSTSKGIVAALPGAKLQDEDGPNASKAADVQRYLDAKPEVFREHAKQLQQTGAGVVAAAKKRDVKQLGELSESLDGVCEECHVIFWYPQQQKN